MCAVLCCQVCESTDLPFGMLGQRDRKAVKNRTAYCRPMSQSETELVNVQENFKVEITNTKSVLVIPFSPQSRNDNVKWFLLED